MIKSEINKWQIHFSFGREYHRYSDLGWKAVSFGIFNLKELPEQGVSLHKSMYKGFIIKFHIWFPIDFSI
jgi:hypothetical protein